MERNLKTTLCFVEAGDHSPSSLWFRWIAEGLGASTCTLKDVGLGREPDVPIYVVERETWRIPWGRWSQKLTYVWFDDAYQYLPDLSPAHKLWQQLLGGFHRDLGRATGFVTPSATLTADFAPDNENWRTIANYHNFRPWYKPEFAYGAIGWGGSAYHWASWRDTHLWYHLPRTATYVIGGNVMVANTLRSHGYTVQEFAHTDHDAYMNKVAGWNVYLIPVAGPYDQRRSWIKALEAAYCGVPWIAVGDAVGIYHAVPGGQCIRRPYQIGAALYEAHLQRQTDNFARARYPECLTPTQEWAELQRIAYHTGEWKEWLLG